jgi:hypothetical protein
MNSLIGFLLAIAIIVVLKVYMKKKKSKVSLVKKNDTIDEQYNAVKQEAKIELDLLLDKVANKGIDSLSSAEKNRLDFLSKEV